MDLYFCGGLSALRGYSLKNYLGNAEIPLDELLHQGLVKIVSEKRSPEIIEIMIRAFHFFSVMQGLSHHHRLSRILYDMDRFFPLKWREISASFYGPQLMEKVDVLMDFIPYHNPVSGSKFNKTLKEIFQEAVENTVKICETLEPFIVGNKPLPELGTGPSLSFGIPNVTVKDATYFSRKILL